MTSSRWLQQHSLLVPYEGELFIKYPCRNRRKNYSHLFLAAIPSLQDFFYPTGSVGNSSREGCEISWNFFKANFEHIKGMIGKGSPSLMDACIVSSCGGFCTAEMADEVDGFFKVNPRTSSKCKKNCAND